MPFHARAHVITRGVIVAIGSALLVWLSFGVALAMNARNVGPASALALWPWAAEARADAAFGELTAASHADQAYANRIYNDAADAFYRAPASVSAMRTMGFARSMAGHEAEARKLLLHAEILSRRDLQTELALIESEVARGDVPATLKHYDYALRTHPKSWDVLMPVLVKASQDPEIAAPLAALLHARPPWVLPYIKTLFQSPIEQASFVTQIAGADLHVDREEERALLQEAIGRLVAADHDVEAYTLVAGKEPHELSLRNGDFEQQNILPPFDWQIADDPEQGAEIAPAPEKGSGQALHATAAMGRSGVVAEQLLLLNPGTYRLTGRVLATSGAGKLVVLVVCKSGKSELGKSSFTLTGRPSGFGIALSIPRNCPVQRLQITLAAESDVDLWLDSLALRTVA